MMAPGPIFLGDNRFSLLSPSPRAKRKKTSKIVEEFPELPVTKKDSPKFLTVNFKDENKPLNSYSIFAVHKSLLGISKDINEITPLRDGGLLLLVKNKEVAKKFLDTHYLPGLCPVTCSLHQNLNCVKGTVYAPFLNQVPENEIIEELKHYNVVAVHKFSRIIEGVPKPTGVVLLSFDNYFLPEKIDIAWVTSTVRPYFPNPMRCRSCQKLGHTMKTCKNTPSCETCNLPPHQPENCIRTSCANCFGEHAASSNICPKYQQAKDILKIKTQNKCSMREALKLHKIQNPITPTNFISFSQITKNQDISYTQQNISITKSQNPNNSSPKIPTNTQNSVKILDNSTAQQDINNTKQQNHNNSNLTVLTTSQNTVTATTSKDSIRNLLAELQAQQANKTNSTTTTGTIDEHALSTPNEHNNSDNRKTSRTESALKEIGHHMVIDSPASLTSGINKPLQWDVRLENKSSIESDNFYL